MFESNQKYRGENATDSERMKAVAINRQKFYDTFLFLVLYGVLWLILGGGKGWWFGAAVILLATLLSLRLGFSLLIFRPIHLPRFVFFYLRELLTAGWQVAYTACHPRKSVAPGWVIMDLKTRSDQTHMLLATFVCLLPGTLTSRVHRGKMHIHLLDVEQPWRPTVEELETHLMALLGERK